MLKMKYLFSILLTAFFFTTSTAQQLTGEWNGSFKDRYEAGSVPWVPIHLKFRPNADNSYTVTSYTVFNYLQKGKQYYDTGICLVRINKLNADSIYLEEIKDLNPVDKDLPCFQKMALKITKVNGTFLMSGTWDSFGTRCGNSGPINFTKRKED